MMFGSQALEVLIALAMMFFLIALLSSAVTEIISGFLKKRAKDLEKTLEDMIGRAPAAAGQPRVGITDTSAYTSLRTTRGTVSQVLRRSPTNPAYISSVAFGNGVLELLAQAKQGATTGQEMYDKLPEGLRKRLDPMIATGITEINELRAASEAWFDERMARLEGQYKRWSQIVLFVVGLAIAIAANASAYGVAMRVWNDPVVADAVSQTASQYVTDGQPQKPEDLKKVADEVQNLDATGLPVGWHHKGLSKEPGGVAGSVLGWVATAVLVMLGAPFWFDLLSRLSPMRSGGPKPTTPAPPGDSGRVMRLRADEFLVANTPMRGGGDGSAATSDALWGMVAEWPRPTPLP